MRVIMRKAWVCQVCGYIHYGDTPPDECPVCGVDSSEFELEDVEETVEDDGVTNDGGLKIVIAGAGIAGVAAAEAARKTAPDALITLLSKEAGLPYYRMSLTRYLAGELPADKLGLHPETWYVENRIDLRGGATVKAIDREKKMVTLDTGEEMAYDRLVLATGAKPFVPPVAGSGLDMVRTLRTRQDAEELLKEIGGVEVVCIGGGLLGLEAAGALARQGALVTVVENQKWLLPRQLNERAAGIFQEFVEGLGIRVQTGLNVKEISGDGRVKAVTLEDGKMLPAGLVLFSAGIRPDCDLALKAGLDTGRGIRVDDRMQTNDPNIYAAGDAAEHRGVLYGTWNPAKAQGATAGTCAAGGEAAFTGTAPSAVLKVLGIHLFSVGQIETKDGNVLIEEAEAGRYSGFLFENGAPIGAILMGDASGAADTKQAVEAGLDCRKLLAAKPTVTEILKFFKSQAG